MVFMMLTVSPSMWLRFGGVLMPHCSIVTIGADARLLATKCSVIRQNYARHRETREAERAKIWSELQAITATLSNNEIISDSSMISRANRANDRLRSNTWQH